MSADFAIKDAAGRAIARVEASAHRSVSEAWARDFRKNLGSIDETLLHTLLLIATPEAFYIWEPDEEADALPSYSTQPAPLGRYFAPLDIRHGDRVDRDVFTLIMRAWLADVVAGRAPTEDATLASSRFLERVKGGTLGAAEAA